MLSLSICKKCMAANGLAWSNWRLAEGIVKCKIGERDFLWAWKNAPPEGCPYYLEHELENAE